MKRLIALTLGAALALGVLSGCTTRVVTTPGAEENRVTVTGEGTALSVPDRATLRFGVVRRDPDPRKAMSDASEASNKLVAALKKAGIAEKDLQTANVNLQAEYSNPPAGESAKITGYRATLDVVAKARDLKRIGDVIVAASDAGAGSVSGIAFELSEDNPAKYTASADAVKDARKRAEAMAKAAGRSLGEVVTMGEPQASGGYVPNYTSPLMDARAFGSYKLAVQPGELTQTVRVTVTFALQ
jgi:uncharacterized protein YggE